MTLTLTPIAAIVVAFVLSAALTPLFRALARRLGAIDRASAEKIHARAVPRFGGPAIAIAFSVPVLVLALRVNAYEDAIYSDPRRVIALFVGAFLMLGLGVYDDLKGTWAWQKLVVQVPAATIAWLGGIRIGGTLATHGFVEFSTVVSLLTTVAFIVLVVNAINLLDGLDGLASGIALEVLLAGAVLAWSRGEPVLVLVCLSLSGAVAGFLLYNFAPASIFMGDSGSLFIGYVLAASAVWSSQKGATVVGAVLPAIALGLPLLDTVLAVFRRVGSRKNPLRGDLEHVHHRLLQRGFSTRTAVLILYGIGLLFAGVSVSLGFIEDQWVGRGLIGAAVVLALGVARWLGRSPTARGAVADPPVIG